MVKDQLASIRAPALQMLEPAGRNTAAAVAAIATETEDPVLLILPSDHSIGDLAAFGDAVTRAAQVAAAGYLVTFGIRPNRPDTGFGYIERGELIDEATGAYRIARFVEKPPVAAAQALIATGRACWNSGMFAFRSRRLIREMNYCARTSLPPRARRWNPRQTIWASSALAGRPS